MICTKKLLLQGAGVLIPGAQTFTLPKLVPRTCASTSGTLHAAPAIASEAIRIPLRGTDPIKRRRDNRINPASGDLAGGSGNLQSELIESPYTQQLSHDSLGGKRAETTWGFRQIWLRPNEPRTFLLRYLGALNPLSRP